MYTIYDNVIPLPFPPNSPGSISRSNTRRITVCHTFPMWSSRLLRSLQPQPCSTIMRASTATSWGCCRQWGYLRQQSSPVQAGFVYQSL